MKGRRNSRPVPDNGEVLFVAFFVFVAWVIGIIVPFATGHMLWGIAALLFPPLAIVIGGFWLIVLFFGVVLA